MKINKLKIIILCVFFNIIVYSQNNNTIIGFWQYANTEQAAGWNNSYRFYKDGSFIFRFNQMKENGRIIGIRGKYKIDQDSIYFKVTDTEEIKGGIIVRGDGTIINDGWILINGKLTLIPQNEIAEESVPIKIIYDKQKEEINYIEIDSDKFFRISLNPDYDNNLKFSK